MGDTINLNDIKQLKSIPSISKLYYKENPPAEQELEGALMIHARLQFTPKEYFLNDQIDGDTCLVVQSPSDAIQLDPNHTDNRRSCIRFLGIDAREVQHYVENDGKILEAYMDGTSGKYVPVSELGQDDMKKYEDEIPTFEHGLAAKYWLFYMLGIDQNDLTIKPISSQVTSDEIVIVIDKGQLSSYKDEHGNTHFRQAGMDIYGRYLGVVYAKHPSTGEWININKSQLLQDFDTKPFVFYDQMQNSNSSPWFNIVDYAKIYEYAHGGAGMLPPDTHGTTASMPVDDRLSILGGMGVITKDMYEWTMLIGDVALLVPPTSINVTSRTKSERLRLLRSKNSIEKGTGHSETYIETSLYFVGEEMINGREFHTKLPNGETATYYMHGLRQLIAQFRKTPLLPINNVYINLKHNIEAVALTSLQISTVQGFPGLIRADLVMTAFEPRTIVHDLDATESLDNMYDWPLYRHYIQKSFDKDEEAKGRAYLKPVSERLDGKITFSLISEPYLHELEQIANKVGSSKKPSFNATQEDILSEWGLPVDIKTNYINYSNRMESYKKFLNFYGDMMDKGGSTSLSSAISSFESSEEVDLFDSPALLAGGGYIKVLLNQPFRYFEYGTDYILKKQWYSSGKTQSILNSDDFTAFIKNDIGNDVIFHKEYGENIPLLERVEIHNFDNIFEEKVYNDMYVLNVMWDGVTDAVLGSIDEYGDIEVPYQIYMYARPDELSTDGFDERQVEIHGIVCQKLGDGKSSKIKKVVEDMVKLGKAYDAQLELAKEEAVKRNRLNDMENLSDINSFDNLNLQFVPLPIDVVVNNISVSFSNTFSNTQLLSNQMPSKQYLGSFDTAINMTMTVTDEEEITKLKYIYDYSLYLVRKYRAYISDGFIDVKNEIINMTGINYVVINNMDINTVPQFPGTYTVQITMIAFDRTQRNKEELRKIAQGATESKEDSDVSGNTSARTYKRFIESINNAEVYPDLELPTIAELKDAGFAISNGNAIYPDPDFYISYIDRKSFSRLIKEEVFDAENIDCVAVDACTGDTIHMDTGKLPGFGDITSKGELSEFNESVNNLMESARQEYQKKIDASKKVQYSEPSSSGQFKISPGAKGLSASESAGWLVADEIRMFESTFGFTKAWEEREDYDMMDNIKALRDRFPKVYAGSYSSGIEIAYGNKTLKSEDMHKYLEKMCDKYKVPDDKIIRGFIHALMDSESSGEHWGGDGKVKAAYAKGGDSKPTGAGVMQINLRDGGFNTNEEEMLLNNPYANIEMGLRILLNKYRISFNASAAHIGIYSPFEAYPNTSNSYTNAFRSIVTGETVDWFNNPELYYEGMHANYDRMDETTTSNLEDSGQYSQYGRVFYTNSYERARWFYACFLYKGLILTPDDMALISSYMTKGFSIGGITTTKKQDSVLVHFSAYVSKMKDNAYSKEILTNTVTGKAIAENASPAYSTGMQDSFYNFNGDPAFTINPDDVFKNSLYDAIHYDKKGRLSRAFPAFFMVLIDEGKTIFNWKMHDNFYGYNAILDLSVMRSRKLAASTCSVQMSNVFNTYWRWDKENMYNRESTFADVFDSFFYTESYIKSKEDERNEDVNMAMLKTGARMHVRLGYSSNIKEMPIVFNGTITEIDQGDVISVVAQGDGIELCNKIPAGTGETVGDETSIKDENVFSRIWKSMSGGTAEPRDVILDMFHNKGGFWRKLIYKYSGGKFFSKNGLGISHFGNINFNLIFKSGGEVGQNVYSAMNPVKTPDGKYIAAFEDDNKLFSENDETDFSMFLYNKTPWDVINVAAMVSPDFIASVEPFEFRSTLFFGKPYYPYAYEYEYDTMDKKKVDEFYNETRNYSGTDIGNVYEQQDSYERINGLYGLREKRKSFQQTHVFTSYTDILDNKIKASEQGVYTCVIGTFVGQKALTKGTFQTPAIYADTDIWPEKQKTTIIDTQYYAKGVPILGIIPGINNLKHFFSSQDKAIRIATSCLETYMKDMYQGELLVYGYPSIKPHDNIYIHDEYNKMNGLCSVQQVVHHMSIDSGFVTSIIPDACVTAHDSFIKSRWVQTSSLLPIIAWVGGKAIAAAQGVALLGTSRMLIGASGALINGAIVNGSKAVQKLFGESAEAILQHASKMKESIKTTTITNEKIKSAIDKLLDILGKKGSLTDVGGAIASSADDIVKASMAGVAVMSIVELAAMFIADRALKEWIKRYLRNKQAISMTLLRQNGHEVSAGINGHQGLVIGDSPSLKDRVFQKLVGSPIGSFLAGEEAIEIANITYDTVKSEGTIKDVKYAEGYKVQYLADCQNALQEIADIHDNASSGTATNAARPPIQRGSIKYADPTVLTQKELDLSKLSMLMDDEGFMRLVGNRGNGIDVATNLFEDWYYGEQYAAAVAIPGMTELGSKGLISIRKEFKNTLIDVLRTSAFCARNVNSDYRVVITDLFRPAGGSSFHTSGSALDMQIYPEYGKVPPAAAETIIREIVKIPGVYKVIYSDKSVLNKLKAENAELATVLLPIEGHYNHIHVSFARVIG